MNTKKQVRWRIKWEFIVALAGVGVALAGYVRGADPDPVEPNDPPYPSLEQASKCRGAWLYKRNLLCENTGKPIFALVTDATRCGTEEVSVAEAVKRYKVCSLPSNGIRGYRKQEAIREWSSWRRGGFDRKAWCNVLESRAREKYGHDIKWSVIRTEEKKKTEFPNRYFYKYFCEGKATWDPIYIPKRSPECGVEEYTKTRKSKVPATCNDTSSRIGYESSRRKDCGAEATVLVATETSTLVQKARDGELAWHKCSTCDALISKPNDRAECLIASAHTWMELGDSERAKRVRTMLQAVRSNPVGVDSTTLKRVKNQIRFLRDLL